MIFPDRAQNDRKMIEELETTCWRLCECIRVRELAAAHKLERMRRLRMLEKQEAWKRETGFDRIEIIAQMDAHRLHVGFDSESLYSELYNLKWPHTPDEHMLEMRVDVERQRMEIVLSQPAPPPQYNSSPRWSPAVRTGLDEPVMPRAGTQSMKGEGQAWTKPGPRGYH